MRAISFRGSAFVLGFAVGLSITWAVYTVWSSGRFGSGVAMSCENFCPMQRLKDIAHLNPDGQVDVKFDRFKIDGEVQLAKFTITNNSSSSVYYSAYGMFDSPLFDFRSGPEKPSGFCGTGLGRYHLHPGESIRGEAPLHRLIESAKGKSTSIETQVGFQFSNQFNSPSETYWADPITVPVQ